ncbi:MAG: fucose isomerase [Planctomycetota bacterium]|jgi:L-fucose isomerase-like protein|nr:fucose isomerase [Planctomycetota bacterium]
MLHQRITLGLAPCRRWRPEKVTQYCNPAVARAIKREVIERLRSRYENEDVRLVDLDFLNEEGLMSDIGEAPAIAERFRREKVDAVFIINCNFGSEEVAGMVGKLVGKPVLLWGPRDKLEANGHRDTDSQCGTFAISKQLLRHHVRFTYIENCRLDAPVFDRDFRRFLAVARMLKNFRGMRVAQVGNRPKAFYSVICNEGELLGRFGIEVIPVTTVQAAADLDALYGRTERKRAAVAELREKYDTGELDDDTLWRSACYLQFYRDVAGNNDCRVIASECASSMMLANRAMPCPAISLLAGEGIIVSCETDVLGAVSLGLLGAAAGRGGVPLFGEFTMRHPDDDDVELIWHCGALPHCLAKEGCRPRILANTRNELMLRGDGDYTLCRLDSLDGEYSLLAGTARGVEGPHTYGAGVWMKFADLPRWERMMVEGPYIHHLAEIPGDYLAELREFVRYYPDIRLDLP